MKFYKTSEGDWKIGRLTIPASTCLKELNEVTGVLRIEAIATGRLMAELLPTEFQKENGDFYASIGELETATNDFFGIIGTSAYKLIALATTNANVVKASGCNLYSIVAIGLTSTVRFLKLYNKATAPTVGTDIPVMTIPIPANTQGAGIAIPFSLGVNFPLGIGIAITAGSADNDNAAVLAGDAIINMTFA